MEQQDNRTDAQKAQDARSTMVEALKQARTAERERDAARAEAGRLADREAHFAHVLSVADSGQYQADWETAIKRVVAQRDAARAQVAALQGALRKIKEWADAYPLDMFPEPDFAAVRGALEAHGLTLDAVSASNMRHAIEGAGRIAREALALAEEE